MRNGYWQDMKEKAEINPCPMAGILSDRAKTFHGLNKGNSFSGLHFLKITFKPGPKNRRENDSQRCNTGGRLCRLNVRFVSHILPGKVVFSPD